MRVWGKTEGGGFSRIGSRREEAVPSTRGRLRCACVPSTACRQESTRVAVRRRKRAAGGQIRWPAVSFMQSYESVPPKLVFFYQARPGDGACLLPNFCRESATVNPPRTLGERIESPRAPRVWCLAGPKGSIVSHQTRDDAPPPPPAPASPPRPAGRDACISAARRHAPSRVVSGEGRRRRRRARGRRRARRRVGGEARGEGECVWGGGESVAWRVCQRW